MAAADQRQDAVQHGRRPHILGCERLALDEAEDDGTGLVMDHVRGKPGRRCRPACRQFVEAHDLVDGDIVADAHHEAIAPVVHDIVLVGDAPGQRLRRHGAGPAGKPRRPGDGILLGCHLADAPPASRPIAADPAHRQYPIGTWRPHPGFAGRAGLVSASLRRLDSPVGILYKRMPVGRPGSSVGRARD
jgi:hypothetical protein